ncbi:MAG: hypothetical protein K0S41_2696 [Anaerocolumna sp.]|jgi:hypothetical protein|nr:hypothetical protein [Anaerocolumna sp.]
MKEYVKPTFEFVELRAEERLATCFQPYKSPSAFIDWLFSFLGFCNSPCKRSSSGNKHCS